MESKKFVTTLASVTDTYMPLITRQLEENQVQFSEYAKQCVIFGIVEINNLLKSKGISWNDPQLDASNIQEILMQIAQLKLNASADPKECYFQLRNKKITVRGENGQAVDVWKKVIEFGVEGDGFDAILRNFGRDVKKVYPFWLVREDDHFEYPKYIGVEMEPPKWEPRGTGKVVRVVYPILHNDDTIHYYIAERADVVKNLIAHINNNLMNETFGIVEDRFKATPEQNKKINEKKRALKEKAKKEGLSALDDAELQPFISPSWKEDFSREEMIIRKMRNNIVKKIPKDFGSPYVQESYDQTTDTHYRNVIDIVNDETASKAIDITGDLQTPPEGAQIDALTGEMLSGDTRVQERQNGAQEPFKSADIEGRQKPNFD